ncbi:MAG: palmitoyltransferase pfa5 [Bogoriella megaspora]|nr:MAG: palmitoyltransferase pfa5 [Bogoriella megaspora]
MLAGKQELAERRKIQVSRSAARLMPAFLALVVGYVTWVVIALIAVHHYLYPKFENPREGAAIVIIVIYLILLFLMILPYFRLLQVTFTNPGTLPLGTTSSVPESDTDVERQTNAFGCSATDASGGHQEKAAMLDCASILIGSQKPPPGLEKFYSREAFICDLRGLPLWCPKCSRWKPDRTHHCSDNGRCVRKMDHFCPWVGGVVSETNFKFFVQFNFYAALFTAFVLILIAVSIAELKRKDESMNWKWIVALAFAAFFFMFTSGMVLNTVNLMLKNVTTTEHMLDRHSQMYHVAVLIPNASTDGLSSPEGHLPDGNHSATLHSLRAGTTTIAYPLPSEELQTEFTPNEETKVSATRTPARTFAVLQIPAGDNVWDLGPLENLKSVMGNRWWDWLVPLRYSPCCSHDGDRSEFQLGPVVDRLKKEHGLLPADYPIESRKRWGT